MALILTGLTKCVLCSETIEEDDDVIGFPAIFVTEHEAGFRFNDAAVHSDCLKSSEVAKSEILQNTSLKSFLEANYPNLWEI